MSVSTDILNLNEFSKETNDTNFKDFTNSLLCFCQSKEQQININDIESFEKLIKEEFNTNNNENYKEATLQLIDNFKKQGFLENENFYILFKEKFKAQQDENDEEVEELKDFLDSELLANANLSEVYSKQEDLQKINQFKDFDDEKTSQENHQSLVNDDNSFDENIKASEEQLSSKQSLKVNPSQMIEYIKDRNNIIFPFTKESTLENPDFMKAFYADLNTRTNAEIESFIALVRAKNEALRAELKALKEQNAKDLQQNLNEEMQKNEALSTERQNLTQTQNTTLKTEQEYTQPKDNEAFTNDETKSLQTKQNINEAHHNPQTNQASLPNESEKEVDLNEKLNQINKASEDRKKADEAYKAAKMRQYHAIQKAKESKKAKDEEDYNPLSNNVANAFSNAFALTQSNDNAKARKKK